MPFVRDQSQKLWRALDFFRFVPLINRTCFGKFPTYRSVPVARFHFGLGVPENFELTTINRQEGVFHIHLTEKNTDDRDSERKNLLSKVFFAPITVQDFPLRGHKVFLHIKRPRWLNTQTGKVVYRDWTQVEKGTRITGEFAVF